MAYTKSHILISFHMYIGFWYPDFGFWTLCFGNQISVSGFQFLLSYYMYGKYLILYILDSVYIICIYIIYIYIIYILPYFLQYMCIIGVLLLHIYVYIYICDSFFYLIFSFVDDVSNMIIPYMSLRQCARNCVCPGTNS